MIPHESSRAYFSISLLWVGLADSYAKPPSAKDLATPVMTEEAPAWGKRMPRSHPSTKERRSIIPSIFQPIGKRKTLPSFGQYTGNKFPACGSTGEVKGANLGYGLSGGERIYLGLNALFKKEKRERVTWWGDRQATIDYCKVNLPRICREFGGDPDNLFICGFSRGAIACSYIGLVMMKSLLFGRE